MHIYKLTNNNPTHWKVRLLMGLFIFLFLIILPIGLLADEGEGKRTEELKSELNAQINELAGMIEKYRKTVAEIKSKSDTLTNEINLLDNQIKEFELEIKRLNLTLQKVSAEITDIKTKIESIEKQTATEKQALSELVREIYKRDDTSFLEMILTTKKFSDFFSKVQAIEMLQLRLQESLDDIRKLKKQLEVEKIALEGQKEEMLAMRAVQETQKSSIENKKRERNKILQETKGQEYLYQKLVSSKQADISKIRSQLYVLQGMGGAISFENALSVAEFAAQATGIRPAFVMAILSRESGLGKNVGTGTWRTDMKPSHHAAFLDICRRLGVDPDQMPVSKKAWYGWGGAMGPAQFIPRTWLGYEKRISAITGHNPPSPWDIEDAFVASALYLANAGATGKTYASEWKAAMIYLAGSNWNKPYLRFYGDQVMDLVGTIQTQINLLRQ